LRYAGAVYIDVVNPLQRHDPMLSPEPDHPDGDPPGVPLSDRPPLHRTVALVGLMGAGKSAVGRRLARALAAPFEDSDEHIAAAAGMSIPEIFERYGEEEFRKVERRVIARILDGPPAVLALGGGAYIDPATRARLRERALTVWLRAELDTLLQRTARKRASRPLLMQGEPRDVLGQLMQRRYPVYAEADRVVDTGDQSPDVIVNAIIAMLRAEAAGAR
jgi:shikimate kinase